MAQTPPKRNPSTIRPYISTEIVDDARSTRPDLQHLSDKAFCERALIYFAENSSPRTRATQSTPETTLQPQKISHDQLNIDTDELSDPLDCCE